MVAEMKHGAWRFGLSLRIRPVVMVGFFPCYCVHIEASKAEWKEVFLEVDLPEDGLHRFPITRRRLSAQEILDHSLIVPAFKDSFSGWQITSAGDFASTLEPVCESRDESAGSTVGLHLIFSLFYSQTGEFDHGRIVVLSVWVVLGYRELGSVLLAGIQIFDGLSL